MTAAAVPVVECHFGRQAPQGGGVWVGVGTGVVGGIHWDNQDAGSFGEGSRGRWGREKQEISVLSVSAFRWEVGESGRAENGEFQS